MTIQNTKTKVLKILDQVIDPRTNARVHHSLPEEYLSKYPIGWPGISTDRTTHFKLWLTGKET